jgi:hypothetical protein
MSYIYIYTYVYIHIYIHIYACFVYFPFQMLIMYLPFFTVQNGSGGCLSGGDWIEKKHKQQYEQNKQ